MKRVLFVCRGNTCRSPMAKVMLEQMLKERGLQERFGVDSAAKQRDVEQSAYPEARQAIRMLYGKDLLADHKPKSVYTLKLDDLYVILTMEESLKQGLPSNKTYTLKEYAGSKGDISDPRVQPTLAEYVKCRDEIEKCLKCAIERLIREA